MTSVPSRSNRHDGDYYPSNLLLAYTALYRDGFRDSYRVETMNVTSTANASATFSLTPDLVSTSSLGVQHLRNTTTRAPAARAWRLPFRLSPADPRVPWTRDAGAADASIRQYTPRKYDARTAPIDVASGIEARLIEAEAALAKGTSAAHLPILNTLRTTLSLPALTDPGTPAERVDQFFRERAFWLYAQGQRLSDLRRLVRQYGRPQNQVFPTGTYVLEGTDGTLRPAPSPFGSDINFPVPVDELNNPQFTQCASRGA